MILEVSRSASQRLLGAEPCPGSPTGRARRGAIAGRRATRRRRRASRAGGRRRATAEATPGGMRVAAGSRRAAATRAAAQAAIGGRAIAAGRATAGRVARQWVTSRARGPKTARAAHGAGGRAAADATH